MNDDHTDAPRCTATAKGTGEQCKRRPVPGGTVCVKHGGGAPAVRAAGARRQQEAAAEEVLRRLIWNPAAAPVVDSVGEMQRLAGSMRQAADVLGERLSGDDCETCGRGAEQLDGVTGTAWVRVLRELRQLLADMERLGIANRVVELEQAKAAVVVAAMRRVLDELALVPADRDRALRVFLAELGQGPEVLVAGEVTA